MEAGMGLVGVMEGRARREEREKKQATGNRQQATGNG